MEEIERLKKEIGEGRLSIDHIFCVQALEQRKEKNKEGEEKVEENKEEEKGREKDKEVDNEKEGEEKVEEKEGEEKEEKEGEEKEGKDQFELFTPEKKKNSAKEAVNVSNNDSLIKGLFLDTEEVLNSLFFSIETDFPQKRI